MICPWNQKTANYLNRRHDLISDGFFANDDACGRVGLGGDIKRLDTRCYEGLWNPIVSGALGNLKACYGLGKGHTRLSHRADQVSGKRSNMYAVNEAIFHGLVVYLFLGLVYTCLIGSIRIIFHCLGITYTD